MHFLLDLLWLLKYVLWKNMPLFANEVYIGIKQSYDLLMELNCRKYIIQIQGGGNAGNCLTALARLGLKPRLLSKARL